MDNWLVKVKNVSKSYKNKTIFRRLSFQISQNSNMALIGVNGSGKTTILHIIASIIGYDHGSISYSSLIKHKEQYNIDIVTQFSSYTRYDKVGAHIKLICGLRNINFTKLIKTPLYEFFKIKKFINKKFIELSGGQKKIVEIFCALCHKPKLIIFDELLNELDLSKQKPYLEYIRKFCADNSMTIIFSAHNPLELSVLADEILVLQKGRNSLKVISGLNETQRMKVIRQIIGKTFINTYGSLMI